MKLLPLPPKINIPVAVRMLEQYGEDITLCPKCKTGHLQLIAIVYSKDAVEKLYLSSTTSETSPVQNKASP